MELKKKIAVLCDYRLMPERVGGMDRFFWLFDAECKALGHEIVWFFPNQESHDGYSKLSIIAANGKSIEQTFLDCKQTFDVVFTHFLELCTPFYKKVKNQKLASKIVVADHNSRPIDGYPLKKRISKWIKGKLYSKYIDLFVAVSNYTKKEIKKDFGINNELKLNSIYNGIHYRLFKKREIRNQSKPLFLVASHLVYTKGVQDLIQAVSLLPNTIKQSIVIDVYGTGNYKSNLENLVQQLELENNFNFLGSVPNLFETYCKYDYLLQPTHMECFSLAILESLSANVPVITTPVGGNKEVIKDGVNGYILPVQNSMSWAVLLEKLYYGNEKITIDTSGLIESNFSIENMVSNYINLISKSK